MFEPAKHGLKLLKCEPKLTSPPYFVPVIKNITKTPGIHNWYLGPSCPFIKGNCVFNQKAAYFQQDADVVRILSHISLFLSELTCFCHTVSPFVTKFIHRCSRSICQRNALCIFSAKKGSCLPPQKKTSAKRSST